MTLQLATVLRRSDDPVTADVDGEVVMMSLARGNYYGLDAVGSRIWDLLITPLPVAELLTQLQAEYEVDADTCRRDTLLFLAELEQQGLVERVGE